MAYHLPEWVGWLLAANGWVTHHRLSARLAALEQRIPMNITQVPAKWYTPGRLLLKPDKIVIHWMDGTLESTDRVFTGLTDRTEVSSHFGVQEGDVHQYVKVGDTAWHAGNWIANLTSVGIEFSAQPGRQTSDRSYATGAELICAVCRQLGLAPSRELLRKHSEFRPTACPGTMDLDRLAREASALWNGSPKTDVQEGNVPQAQVASATVVPVHFDVTVSAPAGRANFRKEPNTRSQTEGTYANSSTFACKATVTGEYVSVTWPDGRKVSSDKWYVSVPDHLGNSYYLSAAVSHL